MPASTGNDVVKKIKNKLNDAELASPSLKAGAIAVHAFLSVPLPEQGDLKRRDWLPILASWQEWGAKIIKPMLKAGGGKLHDEFRVLWMAAFMKCDQIVVDAAKTWLEEQFEIGVAKENDSNAIDAINFAGRAESSQIAEHPGTTDAPIGPNGGDPVAPVGPLPDNQIAADRRDKRGHRKSNR